MSDERYWDERYLQGHTGWDLGRVSPPLRVYFDQLTNKDLAILTDRLRKKLPASKALTLITADFFDHQGQYDLIIEQTFFCALDPAKRPAYVDQMHRLLKPGAKLAGVLFDRNFPGGPPFGGHKQEYQNLLEEKFQIKALAPCYNSIKPRMGSELFLIAENS